MIGNVLALCGFLTAVCATCYALELIFARKPEVTETKGDLANADIEGTEPDPPGPGGWAW